MLCGAPFIFQLQEFSIESVNLPTARRLLYLQLFSQPLYLVRVLPLQLKELDLQ